MDVSVNAILGRREAAASLEHRHLKSNPDIAKTIWSHHMSELMWLVITRFVELKYIITFYMKWLSHLIFFFRKPPNALFELQNVLYSRWENCFGRHPALAGSREAKAQTHSTASKTKHTDMHTDFLHLIGPFSPSTHSCSVSLERMMISLVSSVSRTSIQSILLSTLNRTQKMWWEAF